MHVFAMSAALAEVADRIAADDSHGARSIVVDRWPFVPRGCNGRSITPWQMIPVMLRDGFVDRYTGQPDWHPGALRLLSLLLPDHLPWHPNWRLDQCHKLFWDLSPTIDHIEALTRGGGHDVDNWVTTSGTHHTLKSNFSLAQKGWTLRQPGRIENWGGYLGWFLAELDRRPAMRAVPYLKRRHAAAITALAIAGSTRAPCAQASLRRSRGVCRTSTYRPSDIVRPGETVLRSGTW